jgi:hypothetical protein
VIVRRYAIGAASVIMTAIGADAPPETEWATVERALGHTGALQPGDVFRVAMARSDLKVTVQGVAVRPGFALGSYAAFRRMGKGALVMGDLALPDEEIPKVMSVLLERGLSVTALAPQPPQ